MAKAKIGGLHCLGDTIPKVFFVGIICSNGIKQTNDVQLKAKQNIEQES